MSNREWLTSASPEEAAAYRRGQSESSVTIRRLAKTVTGLRIVLSKIARTSDDDWTRNHATIALNTTMSAEDYDTYKGPES